MKVRIKELAQEAKFIRFEENKIKSKQKIAPCPTEYDWEKRCWKNPRDQHSADFCKLQSHRTRDVREAARSAQLAYAFLKGTPYSKVEGKRKKEKEWQFENRIKPEIKRLANKFGQLYHNESYDEEIENWLKESLTTN